MISRKSSIAAASLFASPCRITFPPHYIRALPSTRRNVSSNRKLNDDVLNSSFSPFAATSDPRYSSKSRVNPPSTTLPAPLDVPDRRPDESLFSYALKSGKKYWAFYKTGIKNIHANYKARKAIIAAASKSNSKSVRGLDEANAHTAPCSRAEFQLVNRAGYDLRRVPIFALLLLLLGEWTPLFVVFCTPIVPFTCRIPRQINKQIIATEERRREAKRQGTSSKWSWSSLRSDRHARYIKVDDALLKRDGKVKDLRPEELRLACYEREISILGRGDGELRQELSKYLDTKR